MKTMLKNSAKALICAGSVSLAALTATMTAAEADEAVILIQMNDYIGPKAYYSLYLVNPEGRYAETLWVSGPSKVWWPDTRRWFGYYSRSGENVDAITGASTAAGARNVMRVQIDPALIDAGYTLRVETSVEEGENHQQDAEVELTRANERTRHAGTGYVRYIRYKL